MSPLPNGCTRVTDLLDDDGRCVMSDLLPAQCGLPCHRNSEPVPIVEAIFDNGRKAA